MFNTSEMANLSNQDLLLFLSVLVIAMITLFLFKKLLRVSLPYFFIGLVGLIFGLIVGSLVANPLAKLPGNFGRWLPLIANAFVTVSIIDLFIAQTKPIANFFNRISDRLADDRQIQADHCQKIVMDTSVLIDGRIEAIIRTGFINKRIVIPQFVLNELQNIADSKDEIKRARGRKGLDILDNLQHSGRVKIEILDELTLSRESVDSRLVKIAKNLNAPILTVDYNLNKVAKIQNIEVLNINELAQNLKPVLVPGEEVTVKIIQEGKDPGQGVGYLNDGTMIVVEDGLKFMGQEIKCEVVRIFQTVAGKMIFVQIKKTRKRN